MRNSRSNRWGHLGVAAAVLVAGCGERGGNEGADVGASAEIVSALRTTGRAARPISPLSGSITGSARPILRWAGPDQVTVQLCADHGCDHPISSFTASGHRARPPRALPPGVVYWRLLTRGAHHEHATSVTWELFVSDCQGGDPSANRGLRYDADADGFADAAVRDQNDNDVTDVLHVFAGGPHGLRATRDTRLTLDTTHFGLGTTAAGDVNGDGFGDVAVSDGRGVVVYAGSPAGPRPTPLVVIPAPAGATGSAFGFELTGLGDVNGDGYGDLAAADQFKLVWVYLGGPSGPDTVADWVLDRSAVDDRFVRQPRAGDYDGDGYGDLVVTDYGPDGAPVGFRFFRGGAGGLESPAAGTFVARPNLPSTGGGDVDGDGVMDLVSSEVTALVLFRGGAGFPGAPVQTIPVANPAVPFQLGDFDGDGDFDLAATTIVGTSNKFFTDARIDLYRAGPTGLDPTPARTIDETDLLPDNQLNFGSALGNADFNGDGREDLLVGAPPPFATPYFDTSDSVVFVFRGSAHGLVNPNPAPRLDGTPGFGDVVSAGVPQSGP